jgi:site-specific recombinase XerD
MAIKPHPTKGPGWWQIVISQGRKQKQKVVVYHGTEAEARALESDIKGLPAEARDCRVVDLAGRFFDWYKMHRAPKSYEECQRSFKLLLPMLGARHLSLLHRNDYERYKAARLDGTAEKKGVSKRTINIELTYFRAFLHWAKDTGHHLGESPILFAKKDTAPKRSAVFSPTELTLLISQLQGDKHTITCLMSHNGLRRDEALHLRRENVDLANRILVILGKGNKTRIIPIVGDNMHQALATACAGKKPGEHLFINKKTKAPYNNIRKAIRSAATRAGIEKRVYNHLLRHSFGTAAVVAGANLRSIQTILGHSDIRTTEIYTHMGGELLQIEAGKIAGLMTPSATPSEMSESKTGDKPAK